MKFERHQIKFEKGLVDGQLFVCLENRFKENVDGLVTTLRNLGCVAGDLELFFATPQSSVNDKSISWIIDADSTTTFEFRDIGTLSEEDKIDIEARAAIVFSEISGILEQVANSKNLDKELIETLSSIRADQPGSKLFAGFDPVNGCYFPVLVGWNGEVADRNSVDLGLRGAGAQYSADTAGEAIDSFPQDSATAIVERNTEYTWLWLLWLVVFLLILWIAYLVLPACGVRGILQTCPERENTISSLQLKRDVLLENLQLEGNICQYSGSETDEEATLNEPIKPIEEGMVIPDTELNNRLEREGGETSSFMVSLMWNTKEDLDLMVKCPNGKSVNYENRELAMNQCGDLDIDANVAGNRSAITTEPIENINLSSMHGSYEIAVKSQENGNSSQVGTQFQVVVLNSGKTEKFDGEIKPGETKVFRFENRIE